MRKFFVWISFGGQCLTCLGNIGEPFFKAWDEAKEKIKKIDEEQKSLIEADETEEAEEIKHSENLTPQKNETKF